LENPIIYIETGRNVPRYFFRNLQLLQELYPKKDTLLFYDNIEKRISSKIPHQNLKLLHRSELRPSRLSKMFFEAEKSWSYKQRDFWQNTTARFFHLYDIMQGLGISTSVHLESDVIVLSELALEIQEHERKTGLAYPMQNCKQGCASIFKVAKLAALEEFLKYVLANWHRKDINDMTLLGEFSNSEFVTVLPTWPNEIEPTDNLIYDAGSIGKYFLGSDARNQRLPFSRRGFIDFTPGSSSIHFGDHKVLWKIGTYCENILTLEYGKEKYPIANLHLHSKRIPNNKESLLGSLKKGFRTNRGVWWELGKLDFLVLLERLYSFANRRIFKNPIQEKYFR